MDTALPQKFPFILDRNLAKANCTGNRVCTSCDTVVLGLTLFDNNKKLCIFYAVCSSICVCIIKFSNGFENVITKLFN